MKTQSTHSETSLSRWARSSRSVRGFLGASLVVAQTAAVLLVVAMGGCKEEFPGIVNVCVAPTVIRTSPASGELNVTLSKGSDANKKVTASAVKVITATFSTPMDPQSINSGTFTLRQGSAPGIPIAGSVSYSDTTAVFVVPNSLGPDLTYTATISTGARDLIGTPLASNHVWSFTTIAPGAPTLVSPVDLAVNQPSSPTLIWNAVSGASSYRLQVSTSNTFATTVYDDPSRTNTSQVVSNLAFGTTYFWRVNANITSGTTAYSDVWSFTVIGPPAAPVLVSPQAGAINRPTSLTMTWLASSGAATYRMQVSTVSTFATLVFNDSTITGTAQPVSGLLTGTEYFWRVNAKNAAGTSAYAQRSFTTIAPGTPTLISPADLAVNQPSNPTLNWNAVTGADTYRLQVSTSSTFAITVFNDSTITNSSQAMSGLAYGTTYFWRVNSKIDGGTSAYSDVWSFTTIGAPGAPTLVAPANLATNQPTSPTLSWNSSTGADTYRLQVSTNPLFTGTLVYDDSTITGTSQPLSGLNVATTYYWRVNAKNIAGTSVYSTARRFTTIGPPGVPILVAPANLATNQATNPTLSWESVTGADTYRLQVSTNSLFLGTLVIDDSTITGTSNPILGLDVATTYYWRVNAKNVAGTSGFSVVWRFTTIGAPGVPILVAPANLAVNQPTNPTMSWESVPGADTYRLQISTVNTFLTTVVDDSSITGTSEPISGLNVATTYYWRVNAKNVAGTSGYSVVWRFTTLGPPAAPVLVSPLAGAQNQPTNLTLSWLASAGAETYRLQVSTSSLFTGLPVYDDSTITGTSQPITGLAVGTTYYWRVNAKNAAGTSAYSSRSFTTSLTIPQPPLLAAPSDGDTVLSTSPTLSWNASAGAETYRLQVDTSSSFSSPVLVFDDSTITGLLQPLSGLTNGLTYYWRVNAKNSGGTSAFSEIWRFYIATLPPPILGPTVSTFGIMATSAITNTGNTVINGDVSLDPGTSMTGFPPGVVNGTIHINDLVSAQARDELLTSYNYLKNLPPGTTIGAGADLGALYPGGIPPGTYTSGSTMLVSTPLVLDAGGNANAIWVFQIGSSFTTGANVSLTGGAQEKNVYWVPTLDGTIGVGTIFYGTIVSGRDVTGVTGAVIHGRILAGATTAGTIALDNNTVNVPAP